MYRTPCANKIYVMDMQGAWCRQSASQGGGEGEFNFPTELRLDGNNLIVVDAMNFRVQVLDKSGTFQYAIGKIGDSSGAMFRPKGIAVDSEGTCTWWTGCGARYRFSIARVSCFITSGSGERLPGQFQLPTGLFIDRNDRIYVADSLNRRVQVIILGIAEARRGGSAWKDIVDLRRHAAGSRRRVSQRRVRRMQ